MRNGLLSLLAPRHPKVLREHDPASNSGGLAISWLEDLKNLNTETTLETEVATEAASSAIELSGSLTRQGDKSAKRVQKGVLALLSPPHSRDSENYALKQGCQGNDDSTPGRPWLGVLKRSLEDRIAKEVKAQNTVPPCGQEMSETLVQQGANSAKNPTPGSGEEGNPGVGITVTKPIEARRKLITAQEHLADVVVDLEGAEGVLGSSPKKL